MPISNRKPRILKADATVTAIASFYSTTFLQLPSSGYRGLISASAPVFGYLTYIAWNFLRSNVNLWHYEFKAKRYIRELETEKGMPGRSLHEIEEINREIRGYRSSVRKRRLDDLDVI